MLYGVVVIGCQPAHYTVAACMRERGSAGTRLEVREGLARDDDIHEWSVGVARPCAGGVPVATGEALLEHYTEMATLISLFTLLALCLQGEPTGSISYVIVTYLCGSRGTLSHSQLNWLWLELYYNDSVPLSPRRCVPTLSISRLSS